MDRSRLQVLLVGGVSTALAVYVSACGGKATSDRPNNSSQAQSAGDAGKDASSSPAPSAPAAPAPACTFVTNSGSSGGSSGMTSCEFTSEFTCPAGDKKITCECSGPVGGPQQGSCSCDGLTFAYDCNDGCVMGAPEYGKCGLPVPPAEPSGGESSSSSSGG